MLGTINYTTNYVLKDVFVMKYFPKVLYKRIENRNSSSFLYVICGSYHYKGHDGDIYVNEGEVVYLPKGGRYTYNIVSDNTYSIQVEFNLEKQNEAVVFSDSPVLINSNNHELYRLFEEMCYSYSRDGFSTFSVIYKLLSMVKDIKRSSYSNYDFKKIAPAVQYIEMNFQKKTYIGQLAELWRRERDSNPRMRYKSIAISSKKIRKYKQSILD